MTCAHVNRYLKVFLFIFTAILCGCVGPSVSEKGSRLNANVVGDVTMTPLGLTIMTPRQPNGKPFMERKAVLNKDRSAILGYDEIPIVAKVDASGPISAFGESVQKSMISAGGIVAAVFTGITGLKL